jgi:hypothetical protein
MRLASAWFIGGVTWPHESTVGITVDWPSQSA